MLSAITAAMNMVNTEGEMSLFKTVPPNVVQSIRAFRVTDLQAEAARLGQHFLYAWCADATTKQQVLATIAEAFYFPKHFGKNFDALADCLTDLPHKAGPATRLPGGARAIAEHAQIRQGSARNLA